MGASPCYREREIVEREEVEVEEERGKKKRLSSHHVVRKNKNFNRIIKSMGFDKRPHTGGRPGPPAAKRPAGAGGSAGPYNGGYAPGKGPPPPAQPMDEDEAAALAAMHNNDDVEDGPAPPEDGVDDDDEAAGGQLEDVAVHLGEAGRNWERPAPAPLDCATQDLSEEGEESLFSVGKSRSSSPSFLFVGPS